MREYNSDCSDNGCTDSEYLYEDPAPVTVPVVEAASLPKKKHRTNHKAKEDNNETFYKSQMYELEQNPNANEEKCSLDSSRKAIIVTKIYKAKIQDDENSLEHCRKVLDLNKRKSKTDIKNIETTTESESESIDDKIADPDYPCKLKTKNSSSKKEFKNKPDILMQVGFYCKEGMDSGDLNKECSKAISNFKIKKVIHPALKEIEKNLHCSTTIQFPEQPKNKGERSSKEYKTNCKSDNTQSKDKNLKVKNKKHSAKSESKKHTSKKNCKPTDTSNTSKSKKSKEITKDESSGNKDLSVPNTQKFSSNGTSNQLETTADNFSSTNNSNNERMSNILKPKDMSERKTIEHCVDMLMKILQNSESGNGGQSVEKLLENPSIPNFVNQNSPNSEIHSRKIPNKPKIITTRTERNDRNTEKNKSSNKRGFPMPTQFGQDVKMPRLVPIDSNDLQHKTHNYTNLINQNQSEDQQILEHSFSPNSECEVIDLTQDYFNGRNTNSASSSGVTLITNCTDPELLNLRQHYFNLGGNIFARDEETENNPSPQQSSGYGSPEGMNVNSDNPESSQSGNIFGELSGPNDTPGMTKYSRNEFMKHGANRKNQLFPSISKFNTNLNLNNHRLTTQNFGQFRNGQLLDNMNTSSNITPFMFNINQTDQRNKHFGNARQQSALSLFNSNSQPTTIWYPTGLSNPKEIPILVLPYPVFN